MKQTLIMIGEQIGKGLGEGLRDYMKRFVTLSSMLILLCGSTFANWQLFQINAGDRREHKAEIKEYADALKTANRLAMEVQSQIAVCMSDRQRQAVEIIDLQFQVAQLKKQIEKR
jgi:23S rRNA pseudoU1915 N3-methylase RlmH